MFHSDNKSYMVYLLVSCPSFLNVSKIIPPGMEKILTCVVNENCTGVTCCVDFTFDIPLSSKKKDASFLAYIAVDPCEFTVDAGIAMYKFQQQMLHYEWGKPFFIECMYQFVILKIKRCFNFIVIA